MGLLGISSSKQSCTEFIPGQGTCHICEGPDVQQFLGSGDDQKHKNPSRLTIDALKGQAPLIGNNAHTRHNGLQFIHGCMGNGNPILHTCGHGALPGEDRLQDVLRLISGELLGLHQPVDQLTDRLPLVRWIESNHKVGNLEELLQLHGRLG